MKKIFLFMLTAGIALYACKKDNDNGDTPTQQIDPANAQEMTAAVKVFHGTNVKGAMPAPGGTALKLAASSNNQTIEAINGRYAVISPEVESGNISGYYVNLTGADSYFKVDYSKPISGRKKPVKSGLFKITGGNADSSIVIQLPANVKPGTFCVEYAAYDAQNNVSNVIKVCITVIAAGADEGGKALIGSWKLNREKQDSVWEDPYKADTTFFEYSCVNDTIKYCTANGCVNKIKLITVINQDVKDEVIFTDNGRYESYYVSQSNQLIVGSRCSNPSYQIYKDEDEPEVGGWSYNSTTKKLTLIYDYDDGEANYDAVTVFVNELSSSKVVFKNEFGELYEYVKK